MNIEKVTDWVGGRANATWGAVSSTPGKIIHGTIEATNWSAKQLYLHGRGGAHELSLGELRLRFGHTSWTPTFYDNGESRRVQEALGQLQVSLPVIYDGKLYPATKTYKYLLYGHEDHPQLLLQLRDPLKGVQGDEVLELLPRGKALEAVGWQQQAKWHVWMNDMDLFNIATVGTGRRPVTDSKSAAELTFDDVASMFRGSVFDTSSGRVDVAPDHLFLALMMITKKSPELRHRLVEFPVQRLKFQKNLILHHDTIALFYNSFMVKSPREEFMGFVTQLREGRIKTWSQFLTAIDEMKQLPDIGSGPAILPHLVKSGFDLVPNPRDVQQNEPIPPSLIINFFGLGLVNKYLELYEENLVPQIERIAGNVVAVQENYLKLVNAVLEEKAKAIAAGEEEIRSRGPQLQRAARAHAKELMDLQEQEIRGRLSASGLKELSEGDKNTRLTGGK